MDSLQGSDKTCTKDVTSSSELLVGLPSVWPSEPARRRPAAGSSHLLEEGRILSQVLGDHVEAEEVTVDALARHGQAVHVLVLLRCLFEQLQPFFSLGTRRRKER